MSVLGDREAFTGSVALQRTRRQHALIPSTADLIVPKFIAFFERHRIASGKDGSDLRICSRMISTPATFGTCSSLMPIGLIRTLMIRERAPELPEDVAELLHRPDDHSQRVRKQLNNILVAEVDPAGRRLLIGRSGAREGEDFGSKLEDFLRRRNGRPNFLMIVEHRRANPSSEHVRELKTRRRIATRYSNRRIRISITACVQRNLDVSMSASF